MQSSTSNNADQAFVQVLGFLVMMIIMGGIVFIISLIMMFTPLGQIISVLMGDKWAWHLSRSTSVVGYLLLTGSVAWGLILSTRISKEVTPPPMALAIHRFVSWMALGFGGLHGFLLLFDGFYKFSLFNLLIPFTGPYMPGAVGLGVIGMYIMWLTSASFAWKSWLGQKNWKRLHMLTFPAYGLVTLHGILAGTDSSGAGMQLVYLGSVVTVLFLTNYRLIVGRTTDKKKARPKKAVVSGAK